MLIGISVALIITAAFAAAISSLSQRSFSFAARDEKGLSTLEWILLVAAVGGLATAGVIIVRNAVSSSGDQVDDTARLERIAQTEVDEWMQVNQGDATTKQTPDAVSGGTNPTNAEIAARCDLDGIWYTDATGTKSYPLRKWRGQFTLRVVDVDSGGTGTSKEWCDAIPTNNLANTGLGTNGPRGSTFVYPSS